MKSVRYMIWGHPHNLDECIDMVQNKDITPSSVSLELITEESPSEECFMIKRLKSVYIWKFPGHSIKYEILCGACIFTEREKKQKSRVDTANVRLEKSLAKINNLGIDVSGQQSRFNYSIIYKRVL